MKNRFQSNDSKAVWRSWYAPIPAPEPELSPDDLEHTALGREQSVAWLLKHFNSTVKNIDNTMAMLRRRKLGQKDRGHLTRALMLMLKDARLTLHDLAWYGFVPGANHGSADNAAARADDGGGC